MENEIYYSIFFFFKYKCEFNRSAAADNKDLMCNIYWSSDRNDRNFHKKVIVKYILGMKFYLNKKNRNTPCDKAFFGFVVLLHECIFIFSLINFKFNFNINSLLCLLNKQNFSQGSFENSLKRRYYKIVVSQ
jgi:hypothetical protein